MHLCVKKKRFITLSQVVRTEKIRTLIREFNATPIKNLDQNQIAIMGAIYQACILIDDYNELFFKDIKVKFIDMDEYGAMRRKYPYAKLGLKFYDK
jgi:hypothetical protein